MGSQIRSGLKQLRAKGETSGKDQLGKELSPLLFKTVETLAVPPQLSHLLCLTLYQRTSNTCFHIALTKKKNQDPLFKPFIPELSDPVPMLEVTGADSELRG